MINIKMMISKAYTTSLLIALNHHYSFQFTMNTNKLKLTSKLNDTILKSIFAKLMNKKINLLIFVSSLEISYDDKIFKQWREHTDMKRFNRILVRKATSSRYCSDSETLELYGEFRAQYDQSRDFRKKFQEDVKKEKEISRMSSEERDRIEIARTQEYRRELIQKRELEELEERERESERKRELDRKNTNKMKNRKSK